MRQILSYNAVVTRGINRTLLCDLRKSTLFTIKNDLFDQIFDHELIVREFLPDMLNEIVVDLIEKKMIVLQMDGFQRINIDYYESSLIYNSMIEFSFIKSPYELDNLVNCLSKLGCKKIELRLLDLNHDFLIDHILYFTDKYNNIQFEIIFAERLPVEISPNTLKNSVNILSILIFGSSHDQNSKIQTNQNNIEVQEINASYNELKCGFVGNFNFYINPSFFFEAINKNICLNRKISIDILGGIKNCLYHNEIYGYFKTIDDLVFALGLDKFKFWENLNKDQIEICRSCEYRYVCYDCRVFVSKESDIFSKPLSCKYDPFSV